MVGNQSYSKEGAKVGTRNFFKELLVIITSLLVIGSIDYELIIEYPITIIAVLVGILFIKIIEAVIIKSKLKSERGISGKSLENEQIRE